MPMDVKRKREYFCTYVVIDDFYVWGLVWPEREGFCGVIANDFSQNERNILSSQRLHSSCFGAPTSGAQSLRSEVMSYLREES